MKPSLVVIGLGNPGKQYAATRHNAGFRAVEALAKAFGEGKWEERQKFQCVALEARILTVPILLAQPSTFMNLSGESVQKLVTFFKLDAATQILVVYDDVDLPLGETRLRLKGGPGTHNGMRSIVASIGDNFPRLRIGLGKPNPGEDLAAWVLSSPPPEERKILEETYAKIPEMVRKYVLELPGEE